MEAAYGLAITLTMLIRRCCCMPSVAGHRVLAQVYGGVWPIESLFQASRQNLHGGYADGVAHAGDSDRDDFLARG